MQRSPLILALLALLVALPAQAQELGLGSPLPFADRAMPNADGSQTSLADLKGSAGTVVIFWSNACPWVEKAEARVLETARSYQAQGFGFALVNANDAVAFPDESAEANAARAESKNYPIAYLSDEGSELARAFGASRTPHIYVFDDTDTLVYVGALDDSPGDPNNVSEPYLTDALDAVLAGNEVPMAQTKAFGCTIKFQ